jgi:hypothetical protein
LKSTFGELAREYIALNKPNWEASTRRVNVQIIEDHLIAKLGVRHLRELTDSELQRFVNGYVEQSASRSFLAKLGLFLRGILNMALDRELILHNPARKRARNLGNESATSRTRWRNAIGCWQKCPERTIWRSGFWSNPGCDPRNSLRFAETTFGGARW